VNLCKKWGLPNEKILLVNNSIDTEKFNVKNATKTWDVITVCRLIPLKGVEELIRTCSALSLTLCIVGDGPERQHLETVAGNLAMKVTFMGNRSESDVRELLQQSRSFVLNSSVEATSYALLEARSMSLFCIARRKTGSEEVITHDRDGLLCDENFPLSSALARFRDDTEFVKSASILARKDTTLRFDQNVNFAKIYEQATG
jgi:glycosyltransferase involved in cell wall biosynthesis